jgi:hypothetical protein
MTPKSPFVIYQEFLSPLMCEEVVDNLNVTVPDVDNDNKPVPSFRHNDESEKLIFDRFQHLFKGLEKYYNVEYRGTEKMMFEWYPQGSTGKLTCDSSEFMGKKWVRTRDRDITSILFLSDFSESAAFDSLYEVYGGKLEFPNHGFGFNPERGTLIMFPSTPHFLNAVAPVQVGDSFQVRIHIATQSPFLYQPGDFPGNFLSWFPNLLG